MISFIRILEIYIPHYLTCLATNLPSYTVIYCLFYNKSCIIYWPAIVLKVEQVSYLTALLILLTK